ncbi:uncharacterized protein DS421_3g73510 [Arachis hypogaea]|nr:uncharacterized protein DS421_3g73510 [Arachis hypogaea]
MDEGLCPLTISPGFDTHWRMGMELACLGGSPTLCASAVPEGLVIGNGACLLGRVAHFVCLCSTRGISHWASGLMDTLV